MTHHPHRTKAGLAGVLVFLLAPLALSSLVHAQDVMVRITDTLTPAVLTVPPGTTITFENADSDRHRIRTTGAPDEFDSGNLEAGQAFTVSLNATGEYHYRDERDPDDAAYHGTITVTAGAPVTTLPGGGGGGGTAPPPATAAVAIGDRIYTPRSVVIAPGGTVTFTNNDDRAHTVTATDGSYDSGIMNARAVWSRTYATAGSYPYFCDLHPDMTGIVTVSSGGTPPPPPPPPPPTTTTPPPPPPPPTTTLPPGAPAPTSAAVAITGNAYSPATVTIAAGGTVTWTNNDAVPHTVTATDATYTSGVFRRGVSWSRTYPATGSFPYFCELHPEMTGTVRVVPPGSTVTPPPPPPPPPPASGGTTTTTTAPPAPPPPSSSGGDLATQAAVTIVGNAFSPASVTIAVGGTVTWTNRDTIPHTVTATDRSFDSDIMSRNSTWSRAFATTGTYSYFCDLHPEMTGTVVVTTPDATAPPPNVTGSQVISGAGPGSSVTSGASGTGTAAGTVAAATATVTMAANQFQPASVTVARGGTVTWSNTDTVPHTVTASTFDSGIMRPGATFSSTFDAVGSFPYACTLHPGMNGTVEVVPPGTAVADAVATTAPTAAPSTTPPRAPDDPVVSIVDNTFPAVTVLTAGHTVTWVNDDEVDHNVIARDGSFVSEPLLRPGERFEHRFDEPGAFPYHCDLHEHMRGLVIVQPAGAVGASAEAPVVTVTDTAFEPADLVVHQGDTVRWTFTGVLPHTVTADATDDGVTFDSGILQPGGEFSATFDTLGSYRYTCTLHPTMVGTITVVPPDQPLPDDAVDIDGAGEANAPTVSQGGPVGDSDETSAGAAIMLVGGVLAGALLGSIGIVAAFVTRRRPALLPA